MTSKAPQLVFTALGLIWGSTWLGIKIGLDFLPPFTFAALRFAAATGALLVLAKVLHARMPRERDEWLLMVFLGIFQLTIPYGLVFWGEQYISSGLAAVLFATLPFFVVLFAHFYIDEKLTNVKALGIFASFAGLFAIFWPQIGAPAEGSNVAILGALAVLGSTVSAAMANVVAKKNADKIDPPFNILIQSAICCLTLSALAILLETNTRLDFTPVAVSAILYLGVFGSALAFVGLYWLLTKTSATNTSLLTFISPILALLLGWAVLGEVPNQGISIGTILILAGVYLTVKPSGRLL
jgi:drug/metabolite transporter (DMT)-like permease